MKPHHHKKRIIAETKAHHVVLSSSLSVFTQNRARQIADSVLKEYATYFEVKVYHRAIVGNHIHLILKPRSHHAMAGFLRVVSAQISAKLKRLGLVSKMYGNIWKSRPWSRILTWGRNYTTAIKYVALNYLEGIGVVKCAKNRCEITGYSKLIEDVLSRGLTTLTI